MAPCAKCVNISWPTGVNEPHVIPLLRPLLLMLLPVAALVAASTQISSTKPIINFSLPNFTPEGYRSWLIRGSEARYLSQNQLEVKELTLSVFSGKADDKIETMILSPSASVLPAEAAVTGADTLRVINDDFEATGRDWRFSHKERRVTIARNVHVVFHTELKDFLK